MGIKLLIGLALTAVLTIALLLSEVELTLGGWIGLSIWEFATIELAIIVFDQFRPGRAPRVPPPEEYAELITSIVNAGRYFVATSSKPVELWEQPTFLRHVDLNTLKTVSEYSRRLGMPASIISSNPDDKTEFRMELEDILHNNAEEKIPPYFYGMRYLIYPEKVYEQRRPFVNALLQKHLTYRMHCLPLVLDILRDKLAPIRNVLDQLSDQIDHPGRLAKAWYGLVGRPIKIPDFQLVDDKLLIWFEGKKFRQSQDRTIVMLAKKVITELAKHATESVWGGFNYTEIGNIAKVSTEAAAGFFSHDYFDRWLVYLEESKDMLFEWIQWENEKLNEYVKPDSRLLDIGCGYGRHLELLLDRCELMVGIDNNSSMVKRACETLANKCELEKWRIYPADAHNLYFPDNSFNAVICMTNTFGNMNVDRKRIIGEMARVTQLGGIVMISVYNHSTEALQARMRTYKAADVGLLITRVTDNRTIYTREGLVSDQFTIDELNQLIKGTNLTILKSEKFRDIGLLAVCKKI